MKISDRISLKVQPLFWLLALLIGWFASTNIPDMLLAVFVIFFSVLLHEFGHALTALFFGQKAKIELAFFGGFTYREGARLKLWQEFLVVLNGPLAGFSIFVVAYLVQENFKFTEAHTLFTLKFAYLVNFFWTIVNLVPVLPLDGGHLLSIVLESIFGFKGVKFSVIIGLVIAVSISIFFFAIGAFLPGALFLLLTFESFRALRYYKLYTEKDRDSNLQSLVQSAEKDLEMENKERAYSKFEEVRRKTGSGILFTLATEEMAAILRENNQMDEAYSLLLSVEKSLSSEKIPLLHYLAFVNQDYDKVKNLSKEAYQIAPKAETALFNSLAFAARKDAEASVGWLECAIRDGLTNLENILDREEFTHIRHDPKFQGLVSSVQKT